MKLYLWGHFMSAFKGVFLFFCCFIIIYVFYYFGVGAAVEADKQAFNMYASGAKDISGLQLRYVIWVSIINFVGYQYFVFVQMVLVALANTLNLVLIWRNFGRTVFVIMFLLVAFEPILIAYSTTLMRDAFLYFLISVFLFYYMNEGLRFRNVIMAVSIFLASLMRIQFGVILVLSYFYSFFYRGAGLRRDGGHFVWIYFLLIAVIILMNFYPPQYIESLYLSGRSSSVVQYITTADQQVEDGGYLHLGKINNLDSFADYMRLIVITFTNNFVSWSLPVPNRVTTLGHVLYVPWGIVYVSAFVFIFLVNLSSNKLFFLRGVLVFYTMTALALMSNAGSLFRTRAMVLPIMFLFIAYMVKGIISKKRI
jgi:hypothetical protein